MPDKILTSPLKPVGEQKEGEEEAILQDGFTEINPSQANSLGETSPSSYTKLNAILERKHSHSRLEEDPNEPGMIVNEPGMSLIQQPNLASPISRPSSPLAVVLNNEQQNINADSTEQSSFREDKNAPPLIAKNLTASFAPPSGQLNDKLDISYLNRSMDSKEQRANVPEHKDVPQALQREAVDKEEKSCYIPYDYAMAMQSACKPLEFFTGSALGGICYIGCIIPDCCFSWGGDDAHCYTVPFDHMEYHDVYDTDLECREAVRERDGTPICFSRGYDIGACLPRTIAVTLGATFGAICCPIETIYRHFRTVEGHAAHRAIFFSPLSREELNSTVYCERPFTTRPTCLGGEQQEEDGPLHPQRMR